MMDIIEIEKLTKKYSKKGNKALDDVNLTIEIGKIYGLIGPNGAGKTTLIKLLLDAIKPTYGTIKILGKPANDNSVKGSIGYVCEKDALPKDDSAYMYLFSTSLLYGLSIDEANRRIKRFAKEFKIESFLYNKIRTFSSGMKKKVQIIAALLNDPKLLILDEPTEYLDPSVRAEIFDFIKKLMYLENVTIILSSHNLYELEKIVDNIILINKGRLILSSSYKDIMENLNREITIKIDTNQNKKMVELISTLENIKVINHFPIKLIAGNGSNIQKQITKLANENEIVVKDIKIIEHNIYDLYRQYIHESGGYYEYN